MWRIFQGIGRGLRSIRPSQCYPQDCSDEAHNCHLHCDEVSDVHTTTLRHFESWSPLTVTRRYDRTLTHVVFGVAQPEDTQTRSYNKESSKFDGNKNTSYQQSCPPWHWHVLQDSRVFQECCSKENYKKKEKENKEDCGNTWHFEEWKEVLQASPTLHTLGLGSATALTLSLYRGLSEHHPCSYQAKDELQQISNEATRNNNFRNSYDEEQYQKSDELFWSKCRAHKGFFNSEVNSQEISSDTFHKNSGEAMYRVLDYVRNTLIYKPDVIQSAETEAHASSTAECSFQQRSLNMVTVFSNQGNGEGKCKIEEIYDNEVAHDNEKKLLFCPQDGKSNVTNKSDSGCVSDLHQELESQTTIKSGIINDHHNDVKSIGNRTLSSNSIDWPVLVLPKLQIEVEDVKTHKEQEKTCANDADMKTIHDRLFEIVKADREDHLQQSHQKDGNAFLDTKSEEAILYYQAGVMMGDSTSAFNLALCYHMGYGITQDMEKARKLYEAAAAAGHGWAIYNLAVMLNQGLGGPCVPERVHSLLQQAAKMGITEAVQALSVLSKERQEHINAFEEELQLRKCSSEPSFHSSLTSQQSFSHSAEDLQSLLHESIWAESDSSTNVICQGN